MIRIPNTKRNESGRREKNTEYAFGENSTDSDQGLPVLLVIQSQSLLNYLTP